ncbi:hypothetical protein GCM10009713_04860 [Brevibacterium celere]
MLGGILDEDVVGLRLVGDAAEDEVAGGEVLDAVAHLGDDTGEVHAEAASAAAGPEASREDREVDRVEAGEADLDAHLSRADRGGLDVDDLEFVGRAVIVVLDALGHAALLKWWESLAVGTVAQAEPCTVINDAHAGRIPGTRAYPGRWEGADRARRGGPALP